MRTWILIGLAGLAVATAGTGVQAAIVADITTVALQFVPSDVTVGAGASVSVQNLDAVPHTVTANGGAFGTGTVGFLGTASFAAPSAAGAYPFFCAVHPFMTGTLHVE